MWTCKLCDRLLSTRYELLKHLRLRHFHHSLTGQYPCVYLDCPCTFTSWKKLLSHTYRTHSKLETAGAQSTTFSCQTKVKSLFIVNFFRCTGHAKQSKLRFPLSMQTSINTGQDKTRHTLKCTGQDVQYSTIHIIKCIGTTEHVETIMLNESKK